MRVLLALVAFVTSALAQTPLVRVVNTSRPASRDFQVGDQFDILVMGAPKQPISVRTTVNGSTDWGPVIALTDDTGRWSTGGRFEKIDFGSWNEVWTVGGKLARPAVSFSVEAPCIPGGRGYVASTGANFVLSCETSTGVQVFSSSASDSFRTPDGRVVQKRKPGNMAPDEYHTDILQYLFTGDGKDIARSGISLQSSRGGLGDESAGLITHLIGVNALSESETRNVLAIIRAVFAKPESIAPSARMPLATLQLLRRLEDSTDQESLRQEIAATVAYVQAVQSSIR